MTELAQMQKPGSRNIALWKEAKGGAPRVLALDQTSSGVVLQLKLEEFEEWTADGRSDRGTTCYPSLSDVIQIKGKH
jgi:hypothetical protein